MKVSNWRKKLASSLLAAGLISPAAAHAASVNSNLVVNPGFENVDLGVVSYYNAPKILDWTGAFPGYCYSHDASGGNPDDGPVPDFANGTLSDGGHWYFSPGNGGNDNVNAAILQDIDVSAGASATVIAAGNAPFSLSAFFSTYAAQNDRGFVRATFLGTGGADLGSATVSTPAGPAVTDWGRYVTLGTIPAATKTIHLAAWGEVAPGAPGSPDGYTDNVSFVIFDLKADFDSNSAVDGQDFLTWQKNFGLTTGATRAQGNTNPGADGDVDADDLAEWKAEFGVSATAVPAINQVPEPSSAAIVAAAASALAAVGVKRKTK